ncbi:hypothetical protein [Streptomyces lavendofoliae]|uniref:Uncharacterized protein n=1 Tax=Streptomyces lavendofoliae TaxID=67314 RepID=A0A918I145_9ACTN|nr:hypothetical protein [Streptomyces lavendofoliae]GGU52621.1 hypothetical protein GCM10010274_46950 [Streptomyces lavendofoliae]
MARIELAYWHDDKTPGDIIEVSDEDLQALIRDGRVARVLDDEPMPEAPTEPAPVPAAPATETAAADTPAAPRRRSGRSDE